MVVQTGLTALDTEAKSKVYESPAQMEAVAGPASTVGAASNVMVTELDLGVAHGLFGCAVKTIVTLPKSNS